jgi:hypothetical protein
VTAPTICYRIAVSQVVAIVVGALLWGLFVRHLGARRARAKKRHVPPRSPVTTAPRRAMTDLAAVFVDGARFGDKQIRIEHVASLHLPSGRVLACDPLVPIDERPFERAVAAGDYPVDVAVAQLPDQQRVAALRVTLAPGAPVRFEPAGDYGVDAGLGCFMDRDTFPLLDRAMRSLPQDGNYYDDVLAAELRDRDWIEHHPERGRPHNIVVAHSGWGDGIYSSYWGLDADGTAVWLVTDFEVI